MLALLDSETLITRTGRGRIASVDWAALLRRWAGKAPIESRGRLRTYLEPRGLSMLLGRLAKSDEKYAIAGELAAAAYAPTAPARLATIWVRDAVVLVGAPPTVSNFQRQFAPVAVRARILRGAARGGSARPLDTGVHFRRTDSRGHARTRCATTRARVWRRARACTFVSRRDRAR